jgi:hypothetical protein
MYARQVQGVEAEEDFDGSAGESGGSPNLTSERRMLNKHSAQPCWPFSKAASRVPSFSRKFVMPVARNGRIFKSAKRGSWTIDFQVLLPI